MGSLDLRSLDAHCDHEPGRPVWCPRFSVFQRSDTLKGGHRTGRFMESPLSVETECFVPMNFNVRKPLIIKPGTLRFMGSPLSVETECFVPMNRIESHASSAPLRSVAAVCSGAPLWLPVGENGSGSRLMHCLVSECFPLGRFVLPYGESGAAVRDGFESNVYATPACA
jgi:hypothetical protein